VAFKTNYQNCLQCAGPDNYNIWRMYGNTLSAAGSSCGLSTVPLAGKQDDVGPAVHASFGIRYCHSKCCVELGLGYSSCERECNSKLYDCEQISELWSKVANVHYSLLHLSNRQMLVTMLVL
jgi:hypothetical protein